MVRNRVLVAVGFVLAMMLSACVSEPVTTSVESATTVASALSDIPDVIDGEFLASLLGNSLADGEIGAVLAVVSGPNGEVASASVGSDPKGTTPSALTPIRMASISKLFIASTMLTLVDDGLLDLDEPIQTYLSSIDIHPGVTARDLLQHSSGLTEYATGDDFLVMLVEEPDRRWTVEETLGLISTVEVAFEPGTRGSYSNTNGIVGAVLIQDITGLAYHDALRQQVLDPLSLDDTYLGGVEDGAEPLGGYHSLFGEIEPLLDMTSIESVAWSSGSIVSTAGDLHTLITALYNGGLLSEASQQEMYGNPERQFGLFVPEWFSDTPLIGHDGRMPGSGTMFVFSPETGISAFVAVNGDHLKVSPTLGPIAQLIGVSTISVTP